MALILSDYEIENVGLILEEAYLKITSVGLNAKNGECFIHLEYFCNKTSSEENKNSLKQYSDSFLPNDPNGNLRQQAYLYLKTLPEFSNATDCI
jgi:hypothetical protein